MRLEKLRSTMTLEELSYLPFLTDMQHQLANAADCFKDNGEDSTSTSSCSNLDCPLRFFKERVFYPSRVNEGRGSGQCVKCSQFRRTDKNFQQHLCSALLYKNLATHLRATIEVSQCMGPDGRNPGNCEYRHAGLDLTTRVGKHSAQMCKRCHLKFHKDLVDTALELIEEENDELRMSKQELQTLKKQNAELKQENDKLKQHNQELSQQMFTSARFLQDSDCRGDNVAL